jgi:hypothetical protein
MRKAGSQLRQVKHNIYSWKLIDHYSECELVFQVKVRKSSHKCGVKGDFEYDCIIDTDNTVNTVILENSLPLRNTHFASRLVPDTGLIQIRPSCKQHNS